MTKRLIGLVFTGLEISTLMGTGMQEAADPADLVVRSVYATELAANGDGPTGDGETIPHIHKGHKVADQRETSQGRFT